MRTSTKLLILGGIVVLIFALAIMKFGRAPKAPESAADPAASESPAVAVAETNHSTFFSRRSGPGTNADLIAIPAAPADLGRDWSDKVDTILASSVPESDKVKQFLEMFPKLPEAGQEAVANHLSNLLPSEDYAQLAKFLTDTSLSTNVLDVLLRDALNRPNHVKLPVLLEVARNPQHPKSAEAKETLAFLLEEDDGDDWAKWQARVDEWLKANPD